MIPLYHWLNSDGGHVHGAVARTLDESAYTWLPKNELIQMYTQTQLNTVPDGIHVQASHPVTSLAPGGEVLVSWRLENRASWPLKIAWQVKLSPGEASAYVHWQGESEGSWELSPGQVRYVVAPVSAMSRVPESIATLQWTLFCYGQSHSSRWRKMLSAWP